MINAIRNIVKWNAPIELKGIDNRGKNTTEIDYIFENPNIIERDDTILIVDKDNSVEVDTHYLDILIHESVVECVYSNGSFIVIRALLNNETMILLFEKWFEKMSTHEKSFYLAYSDGQIDFISDPYLVNQSYLRINDYNIEINCGSICCVEINYRNVDKILYGTQDNESIGWSFCFNKEPKIISLCEH